MKYNLTPTKQLIDLNGEMINFTTDFTVISTNGEKFECLVLDQETLDNTKSEDELQYREVTGSVSGNITSDKNVFKNYYLVLKSASPCEVEVILQSQRFDDNLPQEQAHTPLESRDTNSSFNWKIPLIILVIALILYMVFNGDTKHETLKPRDLFAEKLNNFSITD